ncbi:hypothetical protein I317_01763 [Kwoniella heveanensis CBS 569]|nr:hypothetical protein I317_01763 [Kwoniella heveanensis CBS 569]
MYLDQTQKIIVGCAVVFACVILLLLLFCLFSSRKASREEMKARKALGGRWKESNNTFDVEPLPCIEILNDPSASGSRDSQYQYDEDGRPVPVRRGSGMAGVGTLAYKTSGRGKAAFGGGTARHPVGGATSNGIGKAQSQEHDNRVGGGGGSAAGLSRSRSGGNVRKGQSQSGGLAREGRYPGGSQQKHTGGRFGRHPSEKRGGWQKSIEQSLKGHHEHHGQGPKHHGDRNSWGRESAIIVERRKSRKKGRN